jgi:hypothetical protein
MSELSEEDFKKLYGAFGVGKSSGIIFFDEINRYDGDDKETIKIVHSIINKKIQNKKRGNKMEFEVIEQLDENFAYVEEFVDNILVDKFIKSF